MRRHVCNINVKTHPKKAKNLIFWLYLIFL